MIVIGGIVLPYRPIAQRCPCSGCGQCSGFVGGCSCDVPRTDPTEGER